MLSAIRAAGIFRRTGATGRLLSATAAALLLHAAAAHAQTQAAPAAAGRLTAVPTEASFSAPEAKPLFADASFSRLRPGMTAAQVQKTADPFLKELATLMLQGGYDLKSRFRTYEPYEPVDSLARRLKTSTYSRFENPTGIFFEADETAVLFMDSPRGEKVELRVHDFGRGGADSSYPLREGVNLIKLKNRGLGYISYFTENYQKAPKIRINIPSGRVNGLFDSVVNTNADWKKLLENPACEIMDIRGKYVQLAFSVRELRKFCPDRGRELINAYDTIIHSEQELMGLVKYNLQPKNRMFGRVIWNGYMHADGMGAAFHYGTMGGLANPDKVPMESWGIAHEFGHVNQVRRGMMWVSTTEVTNNIFSSWVNYLLNPKDMRLEHERINGGDGNVAGGRFNAYLNAAVVHGEQWLCQKGPDKMQGYENGGDHFVKLCPLWQLQLYFTAAGKGNPTFYADIFQIVRKTDERGLGNGQLQLNFMKNACDVAKQDLTGFFVAAGMLKPIDKNLDDYSRGQLTITKEECDALIAYAKRYPKPASSVIHYISANSVNAYKNSAPVTGTVNAGVSGEGNSRTVAHGIWKNVTVFETYKGAGLVRVTMVGTGSAGNSSTKVPYPEDSTRIEAVSWDGKRTLVCGKR